MSVLVPKKDHPRVCGENAMRPEKIFRDLGSPPRVRGKPPISPAPAPGRRITPACAGKTVLPGAENAVEEDHPRVCRENYRHL